MVACSSCCCCCMPLVCLEQLQQQWPPCCLVGCRNALHSTRLDGWRVRTSLRQPFTQTSQPWPHQALLQAGKGGASTAQLHLLLEHLHMCVLGTSTHVYTRQQQRQPVLQALCPRTLNSPAA
jgi:hypothetical protein